MGESTLLQLFVFLDIFIVGVIAAVAARYALAHFFPGKHDAEKARLAAQGGHIPAAMRAQLVEEARNRFQEVTDHSAAQLQHDLQATAVQLNKRLEKLSTELVGQEMERYRADLERVRKLANRLSDNAQAELARHQTELKTKMEAEVAAEKQRLLQQIDTKLADAVGSFLTETLQHNIDLGAQGQYLMSMLDEHKADFAKEVGANEARTAR